MNSLAIAEAITKTAFRTFYRTTSPESRRDLAHETFATDLYVDRQLACALASIADRLNAKICALAADARGDVGVGVTLVHVRQAISSVQAELASRIEEARR